MTKLQYFRKKIGISQFELAKYSDVSIQCIQSYEQGKALIDNCRLDNLLRISSVLCVPFYDLLEDDVLRRRVLQQTNEPLASEH